jgi:hypothetical protein
MAVQASGAAWERRFCILYMTPAMEALYQHIWFYALASLPLGLEVWQACCVLDQ